MSERQALWRLAGDVVFGSELPLDLRGELLAADPECSPVSVGVLVGVPPHDLASAIVPRLQRIDQVI